MVIEVQRSTDISAEDMSAVTKSRNRFDDGEDLSERKVSSDGLVRSHKLAQSWKKTCSMEYQAMSEGGMESICRATPGAINNSNASSIVSNLLRKSSGFRDDIYISRVGSGLEHKIQELRAGKEAEDLTKCPSSIHSDQDSPIDFSVKRRTSFSGSLTDDSQASLCSPGNVTDYNVSSPGVDSESANHSIDISKHSTPSPHRFEEHKHLVQPEVDISAAVPTSPLSSVGAFSGLPSTILSNGSTKNALTHMTAAFVDPRNKKINRPFKAYPKDALQMPLGFFGIPGMTPAAVQKGMESGVFAGMNSEDIVSLYNHQLQLLRDKQSSGQDGASSPPFQVSGSNKSHSSQHHHHQQQNHRHANSPTITYPSPALSISPPLGTTDSHKTNHVPISNFSVPISSGSTNGTHVSSTSSFAHSNSRKRPRSLPDEQKDAAYWERRRKNNDAAKRSRDARRAKEDEIAIRAALLEQENIKLRVEVAALKTETARLRCLLYN